MARTSIARFLVASLAVAMLAAPCGTSGPQSKDFAAGAVVIPMDNCYQRRDSTAASQTVACNSSSDEGIFRAYGLVYFLLKKGIPVYWAIDGATPKSTVTALDISVPAPSGGAVVARKFNWATRQFDTFGAGTGASATFPADTGIQYLGGPFVIDAADKAQLLQLLQPTASGGDAEIAKVQNLETVDLHEVAVGFHANQVRPLSGTPPRLAILAINPKPYRKTSFDVMYKYAKAAGFDWACTPSLGDCAGGLGPSCNAAVVQAYLADTLCATNSNPNCGDRANECAEGCDPNWTANITTARFNDPGVPGKVFDVLCDDDFGNASVTYPTTQLALGGYKLLWAPHWDTGGVDAQATSGSGATLGQRLKNIAAFVRAGGNLFAECAAIGALEGGRINTSGSGGTLLVGVPETQFQSTNGLSSSGSCINTAQTSPLPFALPAQPSLQIGDYYFPSCNGAGAPSCSNSTNINGAITAFYPDRLNASNPASGYRPGVQRLISASTTAPELDIASSIQVTTTDNVAVGTVVYMGGHDYSPSASGSGGQTAGTRIVLNTLFNLGFGCADPDTTCATGYPTNSACATGRLKCNPNAASGLVCVPTYQPGDIAEICGNGVDDDCDGEVDEGCAPVSCTEGTTRQCPPDPLPANVCAAGVQTCQSGAWGECVGLRLKSPEACNGKDDDCNGQIDDGTLCPTGVCSNGVCLPAACDLESRCPTGFTCTPGAGTNTCQPNPCPGNGNSPCPAGQVCQAGACVDPCADITCGVGATCSGGACFGGACYTAGCPVPGDVCRQGVCTADPCAGVTCADGTFCRDGDCVRSCAGVTCPAGQTCDRDGFCEPECATSCATGQVCQHGSCVANACAGKGCGLGQVCDNGACVDQPCAHVTCPSGTSCNQGQCYTNGGGSPAAVAKITKESKSGCGCGSASGADLLGGLLGVVLWPRLRRRRARRDRNGGQALALALLAAVGLGACGKTSRTEVCPPATTECGSLCCNTGYACSAGACLKVTNNPHLTALTPLAAGVGGSVDVTLSGEGFLDGAVARFSGAGLTSGDAQLTDVTSGSGRFTLGLSLATEGTVEVRVVNPGGLVSNALSLQVTNAPVPTALSRTSIAQDAGSTTVGVVGQSFVAGMVASLNGQPLPTTVESGTHATVTIASPGTLAVGVYDLTVAAPGGSASQAVKLAIVEGRPTLTCITRSCVVAGSQAVGEAFGTYLYPTSTVYARPASTAASCATAPMPSGCSPLETSCAGTGGPVDASGRCQAGSLTVVIPAVPAVGDYLVEVINPGAPPQASTSTAFAVSLSCGAQPACP